MLLVLTVLLCMSFLTQKGVSICSALGFYLMFTVTIEMSRNSGPKNVFSIFFIVCTTMRWTPWLLQYRFWLLTFCTLAFLWVLKRGYVAHAKDGTDLRATLHSCEMWFRFKKKKATTKQCLLLESSRDIIILEYYCMESTVGVHWRNVGGEGHVKWNTEGHLHSAGVFQFHASAFHYPLIWSHYCFIFSVCSELLIASGFEK